MADDPIIGVEERELDDAALEALGDAYATTPPASLRARVLASAHDVGVGETSRALLRWRLAGSIAAVLVLALGALLERTSRVADRQAGELAALVHTNSALLSRLDEQERALVGLRTSLAVQGQVLRVLGGPRTITAALAPSEGVAGRGRVMVDAISGEAAIVLAGLAPPGAGKVYELWAIRGSAAPEPAGVFTVDAHGSAATAGGRIERPAEVTAFAVSIEPTGGSKTPTGPIVLVGAVSGTSG
jgi:anti-sigma-K factor RskA